MEVRVAIQAEQRNAGLRGCMPRLERIVGIEISPITLVEVTVIFLTEKKITFISGEAEIID